MNDFLFFKPYNMPIAMKTGAASVTAGLWRIVITPIDTVKTTLQVNKECRSIRFMEVQFIHSTFRKAQFSKCFKTIKG